MRRLDDLGRVVLPIEWRRLFNVEAGAPMEIIPVKDGTLVLQRYIPGGACTFCGDLREVQHFAGRPVCRSCATQLSSLAHG